MMGTRIRRVSAVGTLVLAAMTLLTGAAATSLTPAGASAVAPPAEYYVAMGASLVTGTGSTGGADYVNDLYHYAQPLVPGLQLENLGCGGETTTTMIHGGTCTRYVTGSQLGDAEAFLRAHSGHIAFVTIDIGADDVLGCASHTTIDQSCFATGLAAVEANLPQIVAGLRAADATAPIVGLTYYDPFLQYWLDGVQGQHAARASLRDVEELNAELTAVYHHYGVRIASAQRTFGSTTNFRRSGTWHGQTVPANVATICDWTWMCTPGGPTVHPNNTGYAELASAFERVLVVPPIISGSPPGAQVNSAYSFQFSVSGVPHATVRHHGALPRGLTLSHTGLLAGTPTAPGTYPITVSVLAKTGTTASETVTIRVGGA
ncbi:MAG: putative Ig domain-containing protein [Acidimicrobiales bacterium]